MPNLDFYAAGPDLRSVLDHVFERSGCRVFENCSALGQNLLEFTTADEVAERFGVGNCADEARVALQLVVPGAAALCGIRRFEVSAGQHGGRSFRHAVEGWGLIQLYLGGAGPKGVVHSHTNHNSLARARARAWQGTIGRLGPAEAWDWAEVRSRSSALNRFIRNGCAVGKLGSRPVLPAAHAAFVSGFPPADASGRSLLASYRSGVSGPRHDGASVTVRRRLPA